MFIKYKKKEVYAGRIKDTSGILVQYPYFKQGNNEINPDSIRYNFNSQKALIWNSKSDQGGMNIEDVAKNNPKKNSKKLQNPLKTLFLAFFGASRRHPKNNSKKNYRPLRGRKT